MASAWLQAIGEAKPATAITGMFKDYLTEQREKTRLGMEQERLGLEQQRGQREQALSGPRLKAAEQDVAIGGETLKRMEGERKQREEDEKSINILPQVQKWVTSPENLERTKTWFTTRGYTGENWEGKVGNVRKGLQEFMSDPESQAIITGELRNAQAVFDKASEDLNRAKEGGGDQEKPYGKMQEAKARIDQLSDLSVKSGEHYRNVGQAKKTLQELKDDGTFSTLPPQTQQQLELLTKYGAGDAIKEVIKEMGPKKPTTQVPHTRKYTDLKTGNVMEEQVVQDASGNWVRMEGSTPIQKTAEETNEYKDFMAEQKKQGKNKEQSLKAWADLQEKRIGVRGEVFAKTRGVSMYDLQTESFIEMPWDEITKANKQEPGRFIPAAQAFPTMQKQATMKEISTASMITRDALKGLKKDFDTVQRAQFAKVLNDPVPMSAWDAFIRSSVGRTLTPDQVEYMRAVLNLRESAFALRSIAGMGQGSDMLRTAIASVIPSAATFSKAEANSALDKFDIQVNILRTGVPGKDITSKPQGMVQQPKKTTRFTEGSNVWDIPQDQVEAFKKAHPKAKGE